MKYALDALDAPALRQPEQIVLLSPMIGVTAFARFAGFAGLPAMLPAFAKAAWLNISPEYNPYKYNSFPVNAARQSRCLPALHEQINRGVHDHKLAQLPPILAFQSVMDSTVSTRAVVSGLFDQLPANGSELVVLISTGPGVSVHCSGHHPGRRWLTCCRRQKTLQCHNCDQCQPRQV